MNRKLSYKLAVIGFLIVLLLIPLFMIGGLIQDRQYQRDRVVRDIAQSSSFAQQITGPMLVVPYRKIERRWKTEDGKSFQEISQVNGHLYFLPETFDLNASIDTELRSRGIYEARLFHANSHINGHFEIPANWGITEDFDDYRFEPAFLVVGISDIRGIEKGLQLQLNDQRLDFAAGTKLGWMSGGVHALLPGVDGKVASVLNYAFDLSLQGTEQLQVLPVGRTTSVAMAANWPHPSFDGNYLPVSRKIDAGGFSARWQTSFFSTNLEDALTQCVVNEKCGAFNERAFGVSFIDPVDQYLKSERAIKYALLFIALTFAGFFLFEVLKGLSVHPIQYGLVGVALAFFYLLLLSLSEHLGFAMAYALSAGGCVLLIGFYLCHVLHSVLRGMGFALGLAMLYGMLYGLLTAEDYALLMGSLLLFALLGVFMVLTRRLDWYGVGQVKLS
ncbi:MULTISPECIES: cell envelope integrity protein CreD [Pseudomonas]|uniref:Cell envelope integrity protein CreD n=1 Tax=Pseudomonas donghuensis TaxID=1163398 RepID=A0AAP0SHS1_9PSED|nr:MULTISPECIES: cell envelope integrity protein CreD [Pseudomonas]MDF9895773.1 inner membrane protein [Pseudomonas vranovensis]KDO00291.1 cell envelope integrity protein CreD [Pseudomonas donghuensis]MBF4209793.1 cell envelope integrity protein CreD [Pseudomonas donghuensis]MBS7598208.1 cell envelope integrity protein CreD [Pseudomonas sp. RC2C2]MCP6689898.1 cell envelope integrity protein CreD [Pseudomonas donghuensis]